MPAYERPYHHARSDDYDADRDILDDDERLAIAQKLAAIDPANARILAELQSRDAAKARGDFYPR